MKNFTRLLVLALFSHAFAQDDKGESIKISPDREYLTVIINPKYPATDISLRFNDWNKQDGVCKLFGFKSAVNKSAVFSSMGNERVLLINNDGIIEAVSKDYNRISSIKCYR
jgi:hypothetical protein